MKAVDKHADLLRQSASDVGNDYRLGADEAPPAIISMFLGDELNAVLDAIENDKPYTDMIKQKMQLGVDILPPISKDTTDRNRTSPFAFTGNKFEFRSLGSSNSIACANIMLNSAVAESLKIFADKLESSSDFENDLHALIKETIKDHKRIIFNGNGYDDAWVKEATEVRGLSNYKTTPDCMPHLLDEKNVKMLTSQGVFSKAELESRCEIMLENYCKSVTIEANTMVVMAKTQILPAIDSYSGDLAKRVNLKKNIDSSIACSYESTLVKKLSNLSDKIFEDTEDLSDTIVALSKAEDIIAESAMIRDEIIPKMNKLRISCDEAETLTAKSYWPFPSYADLLFGV